MCTSNDRLVFKKDREGVKINISLDLESSSTQKILQKEEIDEVDISSCYVFRLAKYVSRPICV